jgi:hypothetical protein
LLLLLVRLTTTTTNAWSNAIHFKLVAFLFLLTSWHIVYFCNFDLLLAAMTFIRLLEYLCQFFLVHLLLLQLFPIGHARIEPFSPAIAHTATITV